MNRSSSFTSSITLTLLICSFFSIIQCAFKDIKVISNKSKQAKPFSFGQLFNPEGTPPASPTGSTAPTIPCPEPIIPPAPLQQIKPDDKAQTFAPELDTTDISEFDEIDLDETKRTLLESLQTLKQTDPFAYVLELLEKPALFKDQYAHDADMPGLLSKGTSRYAKKILRDVEENNTEIIELTQRKYKKAHEDLIKLHSILKAIKQINPQSQEHKIDSSTVRTLCETLQETTTVQLKTLAAITAFCHKQYLELKKTESLCKLLHPLPQTIHTTEIKGATTDFAEYAIKHFAPQPEITPAPTKKAN